jgi:Uma2 family endonuclease
MRTLLLDPPPPDFEAVLERRRRLGLDKHDEVWEGELHVNPIAHGRHGHVQIQLFLLLAPLATAAGLIAMPEINVGDGENNFRVPDGALLRPRTHVLYYDTAALVLEVVSPGDESWKKFDFYAAHGVDELLIVDPLKRTVDWFGLDGGQYKPIARSGLIELGADELAQKLEWPED